MSDDAHDTGENPARGAKAERPAREGSTERPGRRAWKRGSPTPAEIGLLGWLAAKPRPVALGHCVKRGWCTPLHTEIQDHDGRRTGIVYVVAEAGSLLLRQHAPERKHGGDR